jgi:hypothetical protein
MPTDLAWTEFGEHKIQRSVSHGEYLLKLKGRLTPAKRAAGTPPTMPSTAKPRVQGTLTFSGRDARHVRRLAIGWWYQHRDEHRLLVRDFLARCEMSSDGRTISYYAR